MDAPDYYKPWPLEEDYPQQPEQPDYFEEREWERKQYDEQ